MIGVSDETALEMSLVPHVLLVAWALELLARVAGDSCRDVIYNQNEVNNVINTS